MLSEDLLYNSVSILSSPFVELALARVVYILGFEGCIF